jgi:hypothetical protein
MQQMWKGGLLDMNPEALNALIMDYMTFAAETRSDKNLNVNIKAQVMLQVAQALGTLVPLTTADNGEAELQMKAQEHQMNLEMKKAELGMKAQEHQMKMQHSQAESQMKLQQAQQNHANSLVQSQQSHESKLTQAKESAQSKEN